MIGAIEQLRKDSEGILQTVLDQSQDFIKLISCTGDLEYMNANGRVLMEIDDLSGVLGRQWVELWPDESRDLIIQAVNDALEGRDSRFEAYCPTVRGKPRYWDVSVSPIRDSHGNIARVLSTSRDVTVQNAERQAERDRRARAEAEAESHDIVAREMRHRLKNLLAIVGSIARLTARQTMKTDDFLGLFSERLANLGSAQHLLSEQADLRADLPGLVRAALGPTIGDERLVLGPLPDARLDERSSRAVALILGELQTNARKYGALSAESGKLRVSALSSSGHIEFLWCEECGAPIEPGTKSGSGMVLMKRISSGQPQPFQIEFGERGIVARFAVASD